MRVLTMSLRWDSVSRARLDSIARVTGRPAPTLATRAGAPAEDYPDYYPPVRDLSLRADPEGNLWILPTTSASAQGGLLYDIVNRKGEISERVQLPANCSLNGIGPNGVVYLVCENTRLEKRRVIH